MSLGGCTTGHATRVVGRRAIAQGFLYDSRRFLSGASAPQPEAGRPRKSALAGALVWVELAEAGPQFGRSAMVPSSRRSAFNSGVALTLGMRPDRVSLLYDEDQLVVRTIFG
jgi:hypothetical protein